MGTRYWRAAIDFTPEFVHDATSGPQTESIDITLDQQDDPRFVAFLAFLREIKRAEIEAQILATIPPLPPPDPEGRLL